MSKFLVTVCAFGLLLSFASAQEPSVKEPTPDISTVPCSGSFVVLTSVDPDIGEQSV
jgi:hypothetical protein